MEKTCAGHPLRQVQYLALARRRPSWPAPRAVPGAGKPGRIAGGVVPRRYRGFVRARASSEGLWARAWDGPNVSRSFQTHTGSSVEFDGALHGRCGDIHRCRSPEKTCPEGLTRAWEDLLYPKKTGKVCHGRSLGAPWTSADVLQRFRSLWRFRSLSGDLQRFWSLSVPVSEWRSSSRSGCTSGWVHDGKKNAITQGFGSVCMWIHQPESAQLCWLCTYLTAPKVLLINNFKADTPRGATS